jgi:hypothetical protein
MNFDEQDRQLRSPVARASSPCFRQAGSLSYHFLVGSRITEFGRQNSLGKAYPRALFSLSRLAGEGTRVQSLNDLRWH